MYVYNSDKAWLDSGGDAKSASTSADSSAALGASGVAAARFGFGFLIT